MEIEEGLRNRVVGAVIVTILAMIFLPMLLNDPKEDEQQISSELAIPKKPLDSPSLTATILPDNADDVLGTDVALDDSEPLTATENVNQTEQTLLNNTEVTTTQLTTVENKAASSQQLTTVENKAASSQQPTTTVPATVTPPKKLQPPRLNDLPKKTTIAGRWFVQVASFSEQKNANSLRDKLRAQGFSATVNSTWTKKGRIYKLRVGPELDRQRAEMIKNKLNQLNNVKSIIVSD